MSLNRTSLRLLALALLLASTVAVTAPSPAAAEYVYGCYVACDTGPTFLISGPMTVSDCCGGTVASMVSCPGGGTAYAYGYEGWLGPNFCF